jgi:hypothetical protein
MLQYITESLMVTNHGLSVLSTKKYHFKLYS